VTPEPAAPAPAPDPPAPRGARLVGGLCVAAAMAVYYWLFVFPPRLLGGHDPDRYYHLGLSRLVAEHGLLRRVPQVEDLGWGNYFPDKEFLFHVLTGAAHRLGGSMAVLWLVPVLGSAIVLFLYVELSRRLRPLHAAVLAVGIPLGTAAFLFRLTLLRPHLLAILIFCLLLGALLRGRPRLAGLAAVAFALAYHGFYIVGLVAAVAWLLRNRPGLRGLHAWAWCLGGLAVGIVVNPYFPSNIGMGLLTLRLALGLDAQPGVAQGLEMVAFSWKRLALSYGFLPASLIATAIAMRVRRPEVGPATTQVWFLFLVTAAFTVLGIKTPRAMEYAVPACILLVGTAGWLLAWRPWLPLLLGLLVATQGYVAWIQHEDNWRAPNYGAYAEYARLLTHVPAGTGRDKVFNCEWDAGAFILYARPDLRFVDLLDPTLLRAADPDKYWARQGLIRGAFDDPRMILRDVFHADFVLCGEPKLIAQMDARPQDFRSLPGTRGDTVRLFAVRHD
jgi:hypothetical protein